jgi:hypothetical protein
VELMGNEQGAKLVAHPRGNQSDCRHGERWNDGMNHRVFLPDFEEELRTYPWGAAPPRPGDPLPVLREARDESLPMFMEGRGAEGGAGPGKDAARFGRVDPFGRIESDDAARRAGDPFRKTP